MSTSIKLEFKGDVAGFLKDATKETLFGLDEVLVKSAMVVENTAKKKIQSGTRTGKSYKRGRSGRRGTRSAPKEYPKTDTGSLVRSIRTENKDFLEKTIGSTVKHGAFLELGTSNMEARPWLEPSLESNQNLISAAINKSIGREFAIAATKNKQ